MNIAMFTDTFIPDTNGVAVSSFNLYNGLKALGHKCFVITSNPFSKEVTFEDDIIRIPGLEMKAYGYHFAAPTTKVSQLLKDIKIDVVHIQTEAGMGILGKFFAKKRKIPFVYTYHTMYEDYTYYVTKGVMDTFAKAAVRRFSKHEATIASEFISPSEKTKVSMFQYGVNRYINVIPTGIDFSKFYPSEESLDFATKYKKQHGLNGTTNIIYVGRVAKEKSIDIVIKGYAKYVKENHDHQTRLVIVGGGPAIDSLKELSQNLGINEYVHFVGKVLPSEIGKFYHLGDIFSSASISETQGLTFMEAMAAHKILLCRFDEGLVNVIDHGNSGYFFNDEDNYKDMLKVILDLNREQKAAMIANSLKIVDKYSNELFVKRCVHVYERALRNNW